MWTTTALSQDFIDRTSLEMILKLQFMQNAAEQTVVEASKLQHVTPILREFTTGSQ